MRRLPVYLVIDISESMVGENLQQMQEGMNRLVLQLRRDPYALESVYISVIAFAGIARTLVPLTELVSFYLPRLPIGSGTSIGKALHHLMDCLEKDIIHNTLERKGDWKPLVYFMSDGSSTDNTQLAIKRWKQHYSQKVKLINIGIGKYADLSTLSEISELIYRLDDTDIEKVYRALFESVADSILSQSRSLGIDIPILLNKDTIENNGISLVKNSNEATAVDENYAIIVGLCRKKKLPYLMKYERIENVSFEKASFQYVGTYIAEKDYDDWSDHQINNNKISTSQLLDFSGCPHCGAAIGLSLCSCGQIFCTDSDDGYFDCPGCQQTIYMTNGNDFDITRSRG